jgi:hypothetical protein
MSETTWGAETEPAPKKKTIPTWLWFCGGGCIGAVILAVIIGTWLFQKGVEMVKEARDPEKQWPALAQIIPFDERPPELQLLAGGTFQTQFFVFMDSRGFIDSFLRFREKDTEEIRGQLLSPNFKGSVFGLGGRKNLQAGTLLVQGRELKVLRYDQLEGESHQFSKEEGRPPPPGKGPAILVDLTPAGEKRMLVLQMVRTKSEEPITDEEVQAFFKPFHVGDKR